ncbi:hypothetical protein [Streptomyces sp. NPDC059743]|uniref:hypothetical protein n=1 Tax=Streptomyces sp. NPDC059743 TaxID=3346928 RepID=UPI003664E6E7
MGFDIDKDLYFVSKETEAIKKALTGISLTTTGLSHSMTGVKGDIEGLKAALSVVAATAQILKVDYSLWKIDEKGISFRGVQTHLWSNVLRAEETKAAEKKRGLMAELRELFAAKAKEDDIAKSRKEADKAWKSAGLARTEADKAKRGAELANRGVAQLRNQLRAAGAGADLGTRQKGEFDKMRNSIQGLSQALAGI